MQQRVLTQQKFSDFVAECYKEIQKLSKDTKTTQTKKIKDMLSKLQIKNASVEERQYSSFATQKILAVQLKEILKHNNVTVEGVVADPNASFSGLKRRNSTNTSFFVELSRIEQQSNQILGDISSIEEENNTSQVDKKISEVLNSVNVIKDMLYESYNATVDEKNVSFEKFQEKFNHDDNIKDSLKKAFEAMKYITNSQKITDQHKIKLETTQTWYDILTSILEKLFSSEGLDTIKKLLKREEIDFKHSKINNFQEFIGINATNNYVERKV
jgi:hypothetical protein